MTLPSAHQDTDFGHSFSVPDLMMAQGWAEYHDLAFVVELDRCVEGLLCEEVLAFYGRNRSVPRWLMWRCGGRVIVRQPETVRVRAFADMADALEELLPASP